MTDNEMCNEPYTRPLKLFPSDGLVVPVRCTFIKDHGANHSWFALEAADAEELEKLEADLAVVVDELPKWVQEQIKRAEDGKYDPYLEIMLDTFHTRKNCLRGLPGFRRRRRIAG